MRNAIQFFGTRFFHRGSRVAPGSLEFLFESERSESATANSSFLRMPFTLEVQPSHNITK